MSATSLAQSLSDERRLRSGCCRSNPYPTEAGIGHESTLVITPRNGRIRTSLRITMCRCDRRERSTAAHSRPARRVSRISLDAVVKPYQLRHHLPKVLLRDLSCMGVDSVFVRCIHGNLELSFVVLKCSLEEVPLSNNEVL